MLFRIKEGKTCSGQSITFKLCVLPVTPQNLLLNERYIYTPFFCYKNLRRDSGAGERIIFENFYVFQGRLTHLFDEDMPVL